MNDTTVDQEVSVVKSFVDPSQQKLNTRDTPGIVYTQDRIMYIDVRVCTMLSLLTKIRLHESFTAERSYHDVTSENILMYMPLFNL